VWPILLVIYVLLAAVWLFGWLLARRWCRAPA
jgi:predicted permease